MKHLFWLKFLVLDQDTFLCAGCSAIKCPAEEELVPWRYAFVAAAAFVFGLMWLVLSWRPVFPRLDAMIAQVLSSITGCLSGYVLMSDGRTDRGEVQTSFTQLRQQFNDFMAGCFSSVGWIGTKAAELKKWLKQNNAPEFFKIFLVRNQSHREPFCNFAC